MNKKSLISFCIPCYGSEHTIENVIHEIETLMELKNDRYDYEIICVVDGSPDNVAHVLKELAMADSRIKVVVLSRNFGQANARMASLFYARGDYLVCLDDDGQCPLDQYWNLFAALEAGHDVAIAHYRQKSHSAFRNFGSRVNQLMTYFIMDAPKNFSLSNFFCFKRYIRDQILTYRNPFPYLTGLLLKATNDFYMVSMTERERAWGKSGYTFIKLIRHWLDGFTSFSVKPLRLAGIIGVVTALIGFGLGIHIIMEKIFIGNIDTGYASIFSSILFIGGLIMCMLGLIGEYIGRIFMCINHVPQYVVKEKYNIDQKIPE